MRATGRRSQLTGERSKSGPLPSLSVIRVWWFLLAASVSLAAASDSGGPPRMGPLAPAREPPKARPMASDQTRGIYFARKAYTPEPLPKFEETRNKLPSPV